MSAIKEKIMALVADPASLRAWLKGQPETEIFWAVSSYWCPLACYLTERLGLGPANVSVGSTIVTASYEYPPSELPSWACEFVRAVDGYGDKAEVSRDQALGCLDRGDA